MALKRKLSTAVDASPEPPTDTIYKRSKSEAGLLFPEEILDASAKVATATDKKLELDGSRDLPFSQVRQIYQGRWTSMSVDNSFPKTPAMCALLHNSSASLTRVELKYNFKPIGEQLPFIQEWAPGLVELECSSESAIATLAKIPADRLPPIQKIILRSGRAADVTKLLKNLSTRADKQTRLSRLTHVCVVEVCNTSPQRRAALCRVLSKMSLKILDIDDTIYRCGTLFSGTGNRISQSLEEFRFCNITLHEPLPTAGHEEGGWEIPLLPGAIDRCTKLTRLVVAVAEGEYKQEYCDTIAKMGTVKSIALDVCRKEDVAMFLNIPSLRELIIPKVSAAPKFFKTVVKVLVESGRDIGPRSADPDHLPWASPFIVTSMCTATREGSPLLFISTHK